MKWVCNGCGYEAEAEMRHTSCPKCGDNDAEEYDPSTLKSGTAFSPASGAPVKPAKPARKRK